MSGKVTIQVEARHEATVRRAVAMAEELEQLALAAADGAVFDACEEAVLLKGRAFQADLLAEAVARRIEAAEKRGLLSAPARAVVRRGVAGRNNAG